jgi:hypothetical protein
MGMGGDVMQRRTSWTSVIFAALSIGGASIGIAAVSAAPTDQVVFGTWNHREVDFNYYGMTASYSCDGLENNIRALLKYLGARGDVKVSARGCPKGPTTPGRYASVHLDFYALSPIVDASAPNTVKAFWAPLEVSPTRPYYMGHGDCELLQQMKDLISQNFSLQDLSYHTDCLPREVNIDDIAIKARVLRMAPPALADALTR